MYYFELNLNLNPFYGDLREAKGGGGGGGAGVLGSRANLLALDWI